MNFAILPPPWLCLLTSFLHHLFKFNQNEDRFTAESFGRPDCLLLQWAGRKPMSYQLPSAKQHQTSTHPRYSTNCAEDGQGESTRTQKYVAISQCCKHSFNMPGSWEIFYEPTKHMKYIPEMGKITSYVVLLFLHLSSGCFTQLYSQLHMKRQVLQCENAQIYHFARFQQHIEQNIITWLQQV